ncbi:MAG: response regulator [Sulfuricellaceae bacterium]
MSATHKTNVLNDLTLLFVDDEELIWQAIAPPLRRRFKEVYYARNGVEALEMFHRLRPAVVVTDIQMPQMDGMELVRKIRQSAPPSLPIVVISAYNDSEHRSDLADRHIYKPVDLHLLLDAIVDVAKHYGLVKLDRLG